MLYVFRYQVQLPPYLTCTQCVLQWTYFTANQWGMCVNGTEAQGCGQSETFRNCADIAIHTSAGNILENVQAFVKYCTKNSNCFFFHLGAIPPLFVDILNPYTYYYRDYTRPAPYNVVPLIVRDQVCVPNSLYKVIPGVKEWCQANCLRYPPNCPFEICECP